MRLDTTVVAKEAQAWADWLAAGRVADAAWEVAASAEWDAAACRRWTYSPNLHDHRANMIEAASAAESAWEAASTDASDLGDKWAAAASAVPQTQRVSRGIGCWIAKPGQQSLHTR